MYVLMDDLILLLRRCLFLMHFLFPPCRDGGDDNSGQSDNNGQGDTGGGRGGGAGGGTGDVEGNDGAEIERCKWRWWEWSYNRFIDGIANPLFHLIVKLAGIEIEGKALEAMVKGIVQPLVVPLFNDIVMYILPALLPVIAMAAIPAIMVTSMLAICYHQCRIVSALALSIVFLLQVGLMLGGFLLLQ